MNGEPQGTNPPAESTPLQQHHHHHHHSADERSGFIYALGRIEPRFSSLALEKEFAQATAALQDPTRSVTARRDTTKRPPDQKPLTHERILHQACNNREFRYLARQMNWVHTVDGFDTYLLQPQDPADLDLLIGSVRETSGPADVDLVVGITRGPAPQDISLTIPIVGFSQIYSFDPDSLLTPINPPKGFDKTQFLRAAKELYDRVSAMSGNTGATDKHRALNYLIVRYPLVYTNLAEAFRRELSLTAIDALRLTLARPRSVVEVIFTYVGRRTHLREQHSVRVDVTEEFPFIVRGIGPYYE